MISLPFELRLTNKQSVFVDSLKTASDTFQKFIRANSLGSSDLQKYAGDVRLDGKKVARISYNGRAWTAGKWDTCKEILLTEQLTEGKL